MSSETLSQDEVESLLSTADAKGAEGGDTPGAQVASAPATTNKGAGENPRRIKKASKSTGSPPREKVISYDFKRPERVGKEQMRALQSMHEGFGRNFSAALSALLRRIVEVRLTSVDQLTYSEFVFSLENPTCFNLLSAKPLEGNLILDLNPTVLFPIIDRMLGGGKEASQSTRRPLTEIELRLVSRITSLFLKELEHAWENILPLKLEVERVESNPQLVNIVPPNEVVILVSFELTIADVRGMINLCIPFNAIERFSNQLTSNTWSSYGKTQANEETAENIKQHLKHAVVDVVATLAETSLSTGDLLNLRVGDIITTKKDQNEPFLVSVQGMPKFRAFAGAHKGYKAIRIENAVEKQDTHRE